VLDAQPCLEQDKDAGTDARVGSRLPEHDKVKSYYSVCVGYAIGNQSFVHEDVASNHVHAEEGTDVLDYSGEVGNAALRISTLVSTTRNLASKGNKTTNATVDYAQGDNGSLMTCKYPKSCEDGIGSESGRDLGDPSIASGKGLVGSRYGYAN
jgi:hypothetical protein